MQEFSDKTAPYQIPFAAYGMELRICTNEPELLDRIVPMMPPGWERRARSSTQLLLGLLAEDNDIYSIYNGGVCVHDAPGREYALMMFDAQVQGLVALEAPELIFIHAGVVADRDRAIVMPGLSFAGKTTLVYALVKAGAIYYSDEFAVIDESGRVHPYSKRLSLRDAEMVTVDYEVEELGGVAGHEPLRVGMVISTRYRPGAEWHPRELSAGAGALALLEHAVAGQSRPEQALRYVTRAVDGAMFLEGERGEAKGIAQWLLDAVSR